MVDKASTTEPTLAKAPVENDSVKADLELDGDDFDINDEFITLPESESTDKKSNARRKIEMYWEKKQLREQIGDYDFDF